MTDTEMSAHDEAIADDFERGWSSERIAASQRAWGPAVSDGLPVWLTGSWPNVLMLGAQ